MYNAAQEASSFVAGVGYDEYMQSTLVRRATERTIEIVGEAARRVSDDARTALPEVAWGAIVATRHILAHDYDDVEHEKIWRAATVHVVRLVEQIKPVLDANAPPPESRQDPGEP